jgi:hypothetical protein
LHISVSAAAQGRYPKAEVEMKEHKLNILFSLFREKRLKRDEFEGLVYNYFVNNKGKTQIGHWKEEEYEDFLSWFYPRLSKAIDAYIEVGSTFETYIGSLFRVAAREYREKIIRNSLIEYSAWSVRVPELYAHEEPPVYSPEIHKKAITRFFSMNKGRKNPRQILALVLKCYYYVSDDFLDSIAEHTGIERDKLKEMMDTLRKKREEKDDALYRMKESVYCQYYRCIVYEKNLSFLTEETIVYSRMKRKLETARNRLENMRKRLSRTRTDATNREVAEIIGVTKGAVDSNLHSIRTKWKKMANKSLFN